MIASAPMWQGFPIALGSLSLLALAACKQPEPPPTTERRPLIVVDEAPFLNEAEDDEAAADIGRRGEVVEQVRELGLLKWEAPMDGKIGKHEGRLIEVRQAPADAIHFGWKADLGPEVEVPTTGWICAALARDPALSAAAKRTSCAGLLRRARLPDGAWLAYQICTTGPCPVAVVRGGHVGAVEVEGMVRARTVRSKDGLLLLAWTRWVRLNGAWSGGSLQPIVLSGPAPTKLAPIVLDEVDARDAGKVVTRGVTVSIEEKDRPSVHLVGARVETALADARQLSSVPFDETLPLGP